MMKAAKQIKCERLGLKSDFERFMSFVDQLPNGCWFWTGARSRGKGNRKWYGSFRYLGKVIRAHRFAHDILGGKHCPPGHHRDHTCNFSLCVNPDHIEAVTRQINQLRKIERSASACSSKASVSLAA